VAENAQKLILARSLPYTAPGSSQLVIKEPLHDRRRVLRGWRSGTST